MRFPRAWRIALLATTLAAPSAASERDATYRVRMEQGALRLHVSATLPIAGTRLRMDDTRPAGIAELDSLGWPGLVSGLTVTDSEGHPREVTRDGARGWRLSRPDTTLLHVTYDVDYSPLARLDWPARREAAYRDDDDLVLVGRSLFLTTSASRHCRVEFELPKGWHAVSPWRPAGGALIAEGPESLVENLLVLSRRPRDELAAGSFHLHFAVFGPWSRARSTVRAILAPIARHHAAMMGSSARRDYLVVILPELAQGGEAYRGSFAVNVDSLPGPSMNRTLGNLIAHEMFHQWNGWLLHGADYASTQWFQEGFTEYVANLTTAGPGKAGADWMRDRLAQHVSNARRLTTTLEDIGTHKGPPLYSAGALVAFAWDMRIRRLSGGRRDLGDFFRELLRGSDGGARAYAWTDLRAALEATAPYDWEGDYQSFVRGKNPLPIEQALASVGQRLVEAPGEPARIEQVPDAPLPARRLWAQLTAE